MRLLTLVNVGLEPWGLTQGQGLRPGASPSHANGARAGTHIQISFSAPEAVSTCHQSLINAL